VLDISGSGDEAILTLKDPQNTLSQQWYIDETDGLTIRSKLNDLCLISSGIHVDLLTVDYFDVSSNTFLVGPYPASVELGPCDSEGNHFAQNFEGQIVIYQNEADEDGVCLDVSAGGNVMASKCYCTMMTNRLNQKWSFDYTNNVETAAKKKTGARKNKVLKPAWFIFRTQAFKKSWIVLDARNNKESPSGVFVSLYNESSIPQKWYIGADNAIQSAQNGDCLVSSGIITKIIIDLTGDIS